MAQPLTVAIACPLELVRAGIRAMVAKSGIEVVAEAGTATQLKTLVKSGRKPNVLVVDGCLPGCPSQDGFEFVSELAPQLEGVSVVFLTAVENPTYAARARAVGASNCLSLAFDREELLTAIKQAARKQPATGTGAFAVITKALTTRATETSELSLTPREQQVLSHLGYGLSNKDIANSLEISVETVKEYVQRILRKLRLTDRTQAAVWAVRQKLA
jgi:DNA-binding NarL/FixJ family response regulator